MPYQPRATLNNPYGPLVGFRTEDVLPPSAYYVSPDDAIAVVAVTDVPNAAISLQIRLLLPTGELKLMPYQFSPQQLNVWYPVLELPPVEGYILGVLCFATTVGRGRCYVSVQVMRGSLAIESVAGEVLLQGYIDQINVLSYPTSTIEPTFSGAGAYLTNTQPNQTGANLVFTVPQNTLWSIRGLTFLLATSATAGNREVVIVSQDGSGNNIGFWQSAFAQPPSSNYIYSFTPGGANVTQNVYVSIAGPTDLFLPAQSSLQTAVYNLQPGDQFQSITCAFEEWMGQ